MSPEEVDLGLAAGALDAARDAVAAATEMLHLRNAPAAISAARSAVRSARIAHTASAGHLPESTANTSVAALTEAFRHAADEGAIDPLSAAWAVDVAVAVVDAVERGQGR
ncbi:hypothetical protein [Actinotalea sp. JY-7885]|uniref:hypothetical protein n=1 Tax=Actinotalea sp. JY-7885 TaxID=2758576 RepID=UPI00165D9058|nr:hypothetical protein [Actinotalea sp. JY-7885]